MTPLEIATSKLSAGNGFAYDAGGWRVDRHPRVLADVRTT
jgi:hypothetical protein